MTDAGEEKFECLMHEIASQPIHFFLDFNAVIVNLSSLSPESQRSCLDSIEQNVKTLKAYLEENIREKETAPNIPQTGMAVLQQQYALAQSIETWIASLKDNNPRT